MPRYMKAYLLGDLRKYEHWKPTISEHLKSETIVFVHESLIVTKSTVEDEEVIFADKSPEWEQFCRYVLQFSVPDWAAEATAARAAALEKKAGVP